jgi:hypothetical protein
MTMSGKEQESHHPKQDVDERDGKPSAFSRKLAYRKIVFKRRLSTLSWLIKRRLRIIILYIQQKLFPTDNPFDKFEELWCINLDNRFDRWNHARKEFASVGISARVQRFSAIAHEDGRIGLIFSYIKILEYAKERGLENILIFEDDVKFINNPVKNLRLALQQMDKMQWSMFYLGANTQSRLQKIKPNLIILKDAFSSHAIAYHKNIYDQIIEKLKTVTEIKTQEDIFDVYLCKLQNIYPCFMVNPIIATQKAGYSDIEKVYVNYSCIEERFKENT